MKRLALAACLLLPLPAYAEGWNAVTTNGVTVHSYTPAPRPEPVLIPVPQPTPPPTTVIINQQPDRSVRPYGHVYPLPHRLPRHRRD